MATYIKDDSLNNLNQTLQFLTNTANDIRSQKLREKQLRNIMGVNEEGWKAEGLYETQADIELRKIQDLKQKEELYGGFDATQGGILAQLEKEYGGKTKDYYTQVKAIGLQVAGADPQSALSASRMNDKTVNKGIRSVIDPIFNSQSRAYNTLQKDQAIVDKEIDKYNAPLIKVNKEAEAYNRKAEAFNKNKPQYREAYTGNAVDQHQQLLNDTQLAMDNAGSEQDRLKIYNKYVTTEKSISNHYQEKSDVQGPAFFGIGQSKSNGSSGKGKSDYYLYGDTEQVIEVPAAYMKDSKSREEYIATKYPDIYSQGTVLKRAGTTGGTDMNEYQSAQTKLVNRELQAMDQAKATSAVEKHDTWGTTYGTAVEKTNADLESQGANYRVNGSGEIYYLKSPNRVESVNTNPPVQNTNPPTVDTSRWRRAK